VSGPIENREVELILESFHKSLEAEKLASLLDEETDAIVSEIYGGLTNCLDDELFIQEFLPYGWIFRAAIKHGIRRRNSGVPVEKVMREHILLREAFWKHRKERTARVHDFNVEKRTLQCFNSLFQATLHAFHDEAISIETMDSLRDPLTGVFNIHYFKTRLDEEVRRSERYFRDVSLVLFELGSKKDNDSEKQAELLRAFVRVMRRNARASDIPARVDSSKFGIIATETKTDGAEIAAGRLRAKVLDYFSALGGEYAQARVGVGIASYPDNGYDSDALLKEAGESIKREAAGSN